MLHIADRLREEVRKTLIVDVVQEPGREVAADEHSQWLADQVARDAVRLREGEPYADVMPEVGGIMDAIVDARAKGGNLSAAELGALVLRKHTDQQRRLAVALARWQVSREVVHHPYPMRVLFAKALGKACDYTAPELEILAVALLKVAPCPVKPTDSSVASSLMKHVARFAENNALTEDLAELLAEFLERRMLPEADRQLAEQLLSRSMPRPSDDQRPNTEPGESPPLTSLVQQASPYFESWGGRFREELAGMPREAARAWIEAANFAATTGSGAFPSESWLRAGRARLESIGRDEFLRRLLEWIRFWSGMDKTSREIGEEATVCKGLMQLGGFLESEELAARTAVLAEHCYSPRICTLAFAQKLGGGAVAALGAMAGGIGVPHLTRLKARIRHAGGRGNIEKALQAAGKGASLSKDAIEESMVPAHGLTLVGAGSVAVGEHRAVLEIERTTAVAVRWEDAGGNGLKAMPSRIKTAHAAEWKEIQDGLKQLKKTLAAQRDRFDMLMRRPISWSFQWWKQHYLEHPVVGWFARALVWKLTAAGTARLCCWHDGVPKDADGKAVDIEEVGATVELFHPAEFGREVATAWQEWIVQRGIVQPIKQVFRETYAISGAEDSSSDRSERFAGHIVFQGQALALAKSRGWIARPMGGGFLADGRGPTLKLPEWKLQATLEFSGISDRLNNVGAWTYLRVGALSFASGRGGVALRDVPPRAFSEVMRDVDLMVSVATVANEAEWPAQAEFMELERYRLQYARNPDLPSIRTRAAVVGRLVAGTKWASRCRVEDAFLHVRGDRRSYKIHLGTTNVFVEPSSKYIAVEPSRMGKALYVPFEEDDAISAILGKAAVLTEDAKVKDPHFLREIDE